MKDDGWDGYEPDQNKTQWSFLGSLFYSIIVITTIGELFKTENFFFIFSFVCFRCLQVLKWRMTMDWDWGSKLDSRASDGFDKSLVIVSFSSDWLPILFGWFFYFFDLWIARVCRIEKRSLKAAMTPETAKLLIIWWSTEWSEPVVLAIESKTSLWTVAEAGLRAEAESAGASEGLMGISSVWSADDASWTTRSYQNSVC